MRGRSLITLPEVQDALARTPASLHDLLDALPFEAAIHGETMSSPLEIVSRMAAGEDDWVRQVQAFFGDAPADGGARWSRRQPAFRHPHRTVVDAVEDFARRRDRNLTLLNALEPTDLLRTHAGEELRAISLRLFLTAWVRHDLVSLARIARTLLRYYERQLEPWIKYFSLLAGFEASAAILTSQPRWRT